MGVVSISPIYRKVSIDEFTIEFHDRGGYFETDDLTQEEQVAIVHNRQFDLFYTPDYEPTALEQLRVRYVRENARCNPPRYTNEYDLPPYNKPRTHAVQQKRTV